MQSMDNFKPLRSQMHNSELFKGTKEVGIQRERERIKQHQLTKGKRPVSQNTDMLFRCFYLKCWTFLNVLAYIPKTQED